MRWILMHLNSEFHAMLSWACVKSSTPCDGNNILLSLFSLIFFFARTGRPNHRLTQRNSIIIVEKIARNCPALLINKSIPCGL